MERTEVYQLDQLTMTGKAVNTKLLCRDPVIFEGDYYCIKHQEIFSPGVEWDNDGNQVNTCPYCEWGDD